MASWSLFLHLFIMLIAKDVESSGILRLHKLGEENNPTSHMDDHHMVMIFFTMDDLKEGKTMPIYFPTKDISTSPKFLPRQEADSIPFSSDDLPNLLDFFHFSRDTPQGTAMGETLGHCEARPIRGETKACLTSLEAMLDFVDDAFGTERGASVVTTSFVTALSTAFQNYTVSGVPRELWAPKMVACHTMPYPYAVFYCHHQESESKVFRVPLRGENGDVVDAVAVCHLDTSLWSPKHVSFKVLGIAPGKLPVCHFFPEENLVWIPKATSL